MKAVGYVRVSTTEQVNEGVSLNNQKAKIMAYAEVRDFELIDIIEDAGISAKNLNRPGVQKVLDMVKSKEVDSVIVFKLDRMFRNTIDALETTKQFDKQCVSFHSIQESLDTKSAMGKFFFTIMAGVAEMERNLIGERTTAALAYKRSNGEKTGGDIPFGYNVTADGHLVINENEQKAIRLIFRLKRKGYSLRSICRELEKEGHKTKTGKCKWHPKVVNSILRRAA